MIHKLSNSSSKKLVIVEPQLRLNRGHNHTQISAIKSYFPCHDLLLVAGEDYEEFLGPAVAKTSKQRARDYKIYWKLKNGSLRQRLGALFRSIFSRRYHSLPKSPYGEILVDVCINSGLTEEDLIILPAANLEALESVCHLHDTLTSKTPRTVMRFLEPSLGEPKKLRRDIRIDVLKDQIKNLENVKMYCETTELSDYLMKEYGFLVEGNLYLPCSIDPRNAEYIATSNKNTFRIGVFGIPRAGKGSERISSIVTCLWNLLSCGATPKRTIEFLLQGSDEDFSNGGIYGFASNYGDDKSPIKVTCFAGRFDPASFKEIFLSADAVLLPYDVSNYGIQGSGVIQDAVAAEKTVIHSEGMAMTDFLCHGNAIAANSNQEFARAILNAESNQLCFQDGCSIARNYYEKILRDNPLLDLE